MGITTGLASIKKNSGKSQKSDRPRFFKLKADESRIVRFLQELDPDSEHYDEEAGMGAMAVEYRHPDKFKLRALDTSAPEDGGKCWMAEQGWNPRKSLYILVEEVDGPDAGAIRILNQGFGKSTISDTVIEFAETYGTLRDRPYKITRKGSEWNNTSYSIIPLKEDDPVVIADTLDKHRDKLVPWEEVLNLVPYERQEAYFTQDDEPKPAAEAQPVTW